MLTDVLACRCTGKLSGGNAAMWLATDVAICKDRQASPGRRPVCTYLSCCKYISRPLMTFALPVSGAAYAKNKLVRSNCGHIVMNLQSCIGVGLALRIIPFLMAPCLAVWRHN